MAASPRTQASSGLHRCPCWRQTGRLGQGRVGGAAVRAAAGSFSAQQTISQFLCSEIAHVPVMEPVIVYLELRRTRQGFRLGWESLFSIPTSIPQTIENLLNKAGKHLLFEGCPISTKPNISLLNYQPVRGVSFICALGPVPCAGV